MVFHSRLVAFLVLGRTQYGLGNNLIAGDNRAVVEQIAELGLDVFVVHLFGSVFEQFERAPTFLADCRFSQEALHTAIVQEVLA